MNSSLLQQLKQKTYCEHEQLEQQLQLLRPTMSLSDYRLILESFYGFYNPWERQMIPLIDGALPGFFDSRRKVPLLEMDLKVLESDIASIPESTDLPTMDSLVALLGSLYVVEGATLGGQILARHFADKFGVAGKAGCSFFFSYGPEVGSQWRAFCELLSSYSSLSNDMIIVESAIQTFRCLKSWLPQYGSSHPC